MKALKMASRAAVAGLLALAALSCRSFPKEQLTLDLSNEQTPVSLNAVPKPAKSRTFNYEAGYQSRTVTSSASRGGTTVTASVTMAGNQNQPLGAQMQTIFINEPEWAAITALSFKVDLSSIGGFLSTTDYLLKTEALVPFRK